MTYIHLLVAFLLVIAVGTVFIWDKLVPMKSHQAYIALTNSAQDHLQSLDGLRGLLASFVFFHHAMIWYFYLKNGIWQSPPSRLFEYFGSGSVLMFFMITAFLFFSKISNSSRTKKFDWLRLYISRFLRITPLYLFAVLVMFGIVAFETQFTLVDDIGELRENAIHWLFFGLLSLHDLNGIDAMMVFAGVIWTLPYEWTFYFLLPVWGIIYRIKIPIWCYLIAIIGIILATKNRIYLPFLLGILTVYLRPLPIFQAIAKHSIGGLIVLTCCALPIFLSLDPIDWKAQLFLFLAFTLIVAGNNIFGLLSALPIRRLGDISFSIYLIHPLVLYITLKFVIGMESSKQMSPQVFTSIIFILTPLLVTICCFTYRWIELPAIVSVNLWTQKIRSLKSLWRKKH